jgi:ketosteroid isomerase-like protein
VLDWEEKARGRLPLSAGGQPPRNAVRVATAEQLVARYIAAFNARDVTGVLEQVGPEIKWCPTRLSADRRSYSGHAGVREWMGQVLANQVPYRARVSEVRRLDDDRWMAVGDVVVDGEPVSRYVFTIRVRDGLIAELVSSLTDEETLRHLGRLP